jgi:molybdate transport repressor ModE-like protein
MDWDNLRIFLAVAQAGSLAGAARRLRLSQATVWRRIGALERSLDARLFERLPAGYVLTAAGAGFLRGLDGLERTVDGACRQLTHAMEAAEGEVRVTAPEFVGLMIAEGLPGLAKRHPRLVIELLTGSPAAALMARDVDIAIRAERLPAAGFALDTVFAVGFGLYASPAYLRRHGSPAAIDDLSGHCLIAFDHSMAHVAPKPWQQSGARNATIVFRSSSPHARLAAARAGLGLAMLPDPLVRDGVGLRRVLSSDAVGRLELMMFVSAGLRREPRVTAARDFLAELFVG